MLAEEIHISKASLYRMSVKFFQKTPHEIINDFRLMKASNFLIQYDLLIKEIAYDIGFSDSKYFANKFRNKYGIPPSEYRALV